MIWARSKQIGPDQNNLYPSKTIWTVQNNFGPIEGQGIRVFYPTFFFLNDLFLYLAIDTVFHPSGIIQNGMEISSKSHSILIYILCLVLEY